MIRLLTAPARAGGKAYLKVVTASVGIVARVFTRVIGNDLLNDLSAFVAALETMFGGFRERAEHTYQLLKAPGTAFVVVAAPEPDALREASYFVERLSDGVDAAGRARAEPDAHHRARRRPARTAPRPRAGAAAEALTGTDAATVLAQAALRVHGEIAAAAEHDARMARRFSAAHPEVSVVTVPALPVDVHDIDGLRTIGDLSRARQLRPALGRIGRIRRGP